MRRAFITVPCKTCHHLPSPCRESQAMVWIEIQSEFEAIWTVFGRNLDLSRSNEWSAVDEIKRQRVKSYEQMLRLGRACHIRERVASEEIV